MSADLVALLMQLAQGQPQQNPVLAQLSQQRRDNPEDMFSPEQNLARNQGWAKPGPYVTALSPAEEAQFRAWAQQNNVQFDPNAQTPQDYDMRGFWKAMQAGNPIAQSAIDPNDKRLHFPDYWKTPYAATFSNESQWALPTAPVWKGDQYALPGGHVIYDDKAGKWYGLPAKGGP